MGGSSAAALGTRGSRSGGKDSGGAPAADADAGGGAGDGSGLRAGAGGGAVPSAVPVTVWGSLVAPDVGATALASFENGPVPPALNAVIL